jgi:hypothetical protein
MTLSRRPMNWRHAVIALALLCAFMLRAVHQMALSSAGFFSVSADEVARGIRAAQWAQAPSFSLVQYDNAWLPFELFLSGTALRVIGDVVVVPRVVVFVASCSLLAGLFALARRLFDSTLTSLLTVVIAAALPWFAWLSGTPMPDIYFLAAFVWGLVLFVDAPARPRRWIGAGVCFSIATGFHVQAWIFVASACALALARFAAQTERSDRRQLAPWLAGLCVLSGVFVITYLALVWNAEGDPLAYFGKHHEHARALRPGLDRSVGARLWHYPALVLREGWPVLLAATPAVFYALRGRSADAADLSNGARRVVLVITALSLAGFCAHNLVSELSTAAPDRYALSFLVLLAPFAADGVRWTFFGSFKRPIAVWLPLAVAGVWLLVGFTAFGVWRSFDHPQEIDPDALRAGRFVAEQLERADIDVEETFVVEKIEWDYLGVRLTAGQHARWRADRDSDRGERVPSIFTSLPSEALAGRLCKDNARLLALRDGRAKQNAARLGARRLADFGRWSVLELTRWDATARTRCR